MDGGELAYDALYEKAMRAVRGSTRLHRDNWAPEAGSWSEQKNQRGSPGSIVINVRVVIVRHIAVETWRVEDDMK
jgi:hypothetical protein